MHACAHNPTGVDPKVREIDEVQYLHLPVLSYISLCHKAHKALTFSFQPLRFAARVLTFAHDCNPAVFLSSSTMLLQVVLGRPGLLFPSVLHSRAVTQCLHLPVHCVNSRRYATTKGHRKLQGPWRAQKPVVLDIFQNNTWQNGLCPEPLVFAKASHIEGASTEERGAGLQNKQFTSNWEVTTICSVLGLDTLLSLVLVNLLSVHGWWGNLSRHTCFFQSGKSTTNCSYLKHWKPRLTGYLGHPTFTWTRITLACQIRSKNLVVARPACSNE